MFGHTSPFSLRHGDCTIHLFVESTLPAVVSATYGRDIISCAIC